MGIGLSLVFLSSAILVGGIIKEVITPTEQTPPESPFKQEPKRARNGQLIIENRDLWLFDTRTFGAAQAHKWACEGKYNNPTEK